MKCPEKCAPKAKGGESKKSWKKRKTKPGMHSVEVTVTAGEPVDETAWPMFTVVGSQENCKELIVPVLIGGKRVDFELDTRASVTILIPNYVFVLAAKSFIQGMKSQFLVRPRPRCRMVINRPAFQLLSQPVMVQHLWDDTGCPFLT